MPKYVIENPTAPYLEIDETDGTIHIYVGGCDTTVDYGRAEKFDSRDEAERVLSRIEPAHERPNWKIIEV